MWSEIQTEPCHLQGKGQGHMNRRKKITIPSGSVLAFHVALLVIDSNSCNWGEWEDWWVVMLRGIQCSWSRCSTWLGSAWGGWDVPPLSLFCSPEVMLFPEKKQKTFKPAGEIVEPFMCQA